MTKRQRLEEYQTLEWTNTTCARIAVASISFEWEPESLAKGSDDSSDVSLLEELFSPLGKTTFLQHCFRSCAVYGEYRKGVSNQRFRPLIDEWLFGLDPRRIFQETSSESIFVWLQQPETKRIHSIEVSDPESAYQLYQAGHATYCRAPPMLEQALVQALLTDTGLGCGQYDPSGQRLTALGRGEVEVFLSRTAGHVTNWHYDFQENFTLQLSGVKRWTIQKGTVSHPLRGCTPHYNAPEAVESQLLSARLANPKFQFGAPETGTTAIGSIETIELHPGDSFYFPAGMWHTIEVIEPGVSINVSLMATNYAAITCQALHHLLLRNDAWRECIQGDMAPQKLQSLLTALPEIVQNLATNIGSNAILPPCVVNPSMTRTISKRSDEMEQNEEEESVEDEDEDIPTDIMTFSAEFGSMSLAERTQHCNTHRLVINPLGSLLNESKDILRPYDLQDDDDENSIIYILNVNFAGNETHESFVRTRFTVDENIMEELIETVHTLRGEMTSRDVARVDFVRLVDYLVYHGYLLWSSKSA